MANICNTGKNCLSRPLHTSTSTTTQFTHHQTRHASFLHRPHRPYTFTQLVELSDGSTYTTRTTSPASLYKSTKDSLNHPMWQPSLRSLQNIEADEAGRLRAFRTRFGRGWDAGEGGEEGEAGAVGKEGEGGKGEEESLMDLISRGAERMGGKKGEGKGKK